jgi:tetratricopeptide (TPR) repeat protein
VTGIEYIQVGRALEKAGHTPEAITYYKTAVNLSRHDAETHSTALRYLGLVYYSLPRPEIAHQAFMQAAKVYSGGHVVEPPGYIANNIAQAYLLDAKEQIDYSCRTAHTELMVGQNAIGSFAQNLVVQYLMGAVPKEYQSKCGGKV